MIGFIRIVVVTIFLFTVGSSLLGQANKSGLIASQFRNVSINNDEFVEYDSVSLSDICADVIYKIKTELPRVDIELLNFQDVAFIPFIKKDTTDSVSNKYIHYLSDRFISTLDNKLDDSSRIIFLNDLKPDITKPIMKYIGLKLKSYQKNDPIDDFYQNISYDYSPPFQLTILGQVTKNDLTANNYLFELFVFSPSHICELKYVSGQKTVKSSSSLNSWYRIK